ncbi:hypothetical protein EDB83DRAFT_2317178 [Lactarius deliciosus]|nr:hypothetical protein EDB83DRAFT_2317178 [Lactarius deliciosus]
MSTVSTCTIQNGNSYSRVLVGTSTHHKRVTLRHSATTAPTTTPVNAMLTTTPAVGMTANNNSAVDNAADDSSDATMAGGQRQMPFSHKQTCKPPSWPVTATTTNNNGAADDVADNDGGQHRTPVACKPPSWPTTPTTTDNNNAVDDTADDSSDATTMGGNEGLYYIVVLVTIYYFLLHEYSTTVIITRAQCIQEQLQLVVVGCNQLEDIVGSSNRNCTSPCWAPTATGSLVVWGCGPVEFQFFSGWTNWT